MLQLAFNVAFDEEKHECWFEGRKLSGVAVPPDGLGAFICPYLLCHPTETRCTALPGLSRSTAPG